MELIIACSQSVTDGVTWLQLRSILLFGYYSDYASLMFTRRLDSLVTAFSMCEEWSGAVSKKTLKKLIHRDLGESGRAIPLSPLLHIVSGNTPHAAFQSVLRGLLVGAHNRVKLPRAGLPTFEAWYKMLPEELKSLIEINDELPDDWISSAEAVVAYGSDSTLADIQNKLRPDQRFIAHGHKVSIGIITEVNAKAARYAAQDVSLFDQQGCLSLINLYCPVDQLTQFSHMLAVEMQNYEDKHPRGDIPISASGAITNLRLLTQFRAANTEDIQIWQSAGNTNWTVIASQDNSIEPTPLYRTVIVKPLPDDISELGENVRYLSTIALYPYTQEAAELYTRLPASRICPLGQTQQPTIFWNADGYSTLGSLVRWQDFG